METNETRKTARQIEDLPVDAEQADAVKGGVIDPNERAFNFTQYVSDAAVKTQVDSQKV